MARARTSAERVGSLNRSMPCIRPKPGRAIRHGMGRRHDRPGDGTGTGAVAGSASTGWSTKRLMRRASRGGCRRTARSAGVGGVGRFGWKRGIQREVPRVPRARVADQSTGDHRPLYNSASAVRTATETAPAAPITPCTSGPGVPRQRPITTAGQTSVVASTSTTRRATGAPKVVAASVATAVAATAQRSAAGESRRCGRSGAGPLAALALAATGSNAWPTRAGTGRPSSRATRTWSMLWRIHQRFERYRSVFSRLAETWAPTR